MSDARPPAPPPEVAVLLVRHGESTWNAEGRWQGQADPPLTDTGREQARAAFNSATPEEQERMLSEAQARRDELQKQSDELNLRFASR